MSDNEDSTASLGDSHVLSVQHAVGVPIPEFSQRPEDGTHVSAVRCEAPSFARRGATGRQKPWDVLNDQPTGSEFVSETHELVEQPGSLSSQASAPASQADVLAGESSTENIDIWSSVCFESLTRDLSHVLVPGHIRPVALEHAACRLVDLDLPGDLEPSGLEAELETTDA